MLQQVLVAWAYDTFVPIVVAGSNIEASRVYRPIETVDIAPTLSAVVGAKPPSGSRGQLLKEVLNDLSSLKIARDEAASP